MCYAIPGKITAIDNSIVTLEYFNQKKRARNEFFKLDLDDYVYAQGGFVIQKIEKEEAESILETWNEYFKKLEEIDIRITENPKNLYQRANAIRRNYIGNACCVHGIIEFSNFCRCDCLYCGIRRDNTKIQRYRMTVDEIIDACDNAVNKLKFKALVLQSGEDLSYDDDVLVDLIKRVREKCAALITISIGERDLDTYKKLYDVGARGVLLRFETGIEKLYRVLKPDHTLASRISLIKELKAYGYLVMTGFLIGLPDQTEKDVLYDIKLTHSLNPEMFSFGPFIPHPETPLGSAKVATLEDVLKTIARTRIQYPKALIPVTTATETLDKANGARMGLASGANSIMINVSPQKYKELYEIYKNRAGIDIKINERIENVLNMLQELGRAPTDLGV